VSVNEGASSNSKLCACAYWKELSLSFGVKRIGAHAEKGYADAGLRVSNLLLNPSVHYPTRVPQLPEASIPAPLRMTFAASRNFRRGRGRNNESNG
jgi:hypothetical protein